MLKKAIWRALLRTGLAVLAVVGFVGIIKGLNVVTEMCLKPLSMLYAVVNENREIFILLVVILLLGSLILEFIYLKFGKRIYIWMKQRERKKAAKKAEKEKKKAAKKAEKAEKKAES